MSSDALLGIILLVGWLILIGAGMMRRREPAGRLLKQAALWVLVIGLAWAIASLGLHRR